MAQRSLTFNITTNDAQTIAALKRMQSEIAKTGGAATRQTEAVGAVTGKVSGYIKGFLGLAVARQVVEQGNLAETTLAKTDAVIKSTGNSAQVSAGQQDKLVKSLSETAGVLPQVVAGGANLLRTFTNVKGDVFGKALASSMDLAAAKGIDLTSAVTLVGKALQDPEKGYARLARVVGPFNKAQIDSIKNMEDAGNVAGAQQVILDKLATSFGGAAKASATESGRLAVSLQEVEQNAAKALAPIVKLGAQGAGAFSHLAGPAQTATLGLVAFAAVFPKIKSGATTIKEAASGVASYAKSVGVSKEAASAAAAAQTELTAATAASADADAAYEAAATSVATTDGEVAAAANAAAAAQERLAAATAAAAEASTTGGIAATGLAAGLGGVAALPLGGLSLGGTLTHDSKTLSGDATQLTKALADLADGGKNVDAVFKQLGTDAQHPFDLLKVYGDGAGHSKENIKALNDDLKSVLAIKGPKDAKRAYDELAQAFKDAGGDASTTTTIFGPFLTALKSAGKGAHDLSTEVKASDVDLQHLSATLGAVKAADRAEAIFQAQEGLAKATSDVASAESDLATARQAEAGNSDEYRAAQQQQIDDTKAERQAVEDLATARKDESKAVEDAKRHLDDLRQSVISTGVAERDAQLAKDEAVAKAKATIANLASTPLEREQAQVALADATDQVTIATQNHAKAEADSAKATIDNDAGVVAAKQKVVDAENKIKDAQTRVAADAVAKGKIIQAATQLVKADQDKVNDALKTWADRYYDVQKATVGPLTALKDYAGVLASIEASIGPNGTFPADLGAMLARLNAALADPNLPVTGRGQGELAGTGRPAPHAPGQPGLAAGQRVTGGVHITQITQGTPTQTRRANSRAAQRELERAFQRTR